MQVAGFDWDAGKRQKCVRHGVSVEEIEELFTDVVQVAPDIHHSQTEDRFIAVGRTAAGRALFVAFTLRVLFGRVRVRPISARYMHAKEATRYASSTSEDG